MQASGGRLKAAQTGTLESVPYVGQPFLAAGWRDILVPQSELHASCPDKFTWNKP
jgi:hypothetical protein